MPPLWHSSNSCSFHEVGSITSLLNFLTSNHPMSHTQCHVQHALSTIYCLTFKWVEAVRFYARAAESILNDSQCACAAAQPAHKVGFGRNVATRLLNFIKIGDHVYCLYRQERLVEKTNKISTTISKLKTATIQRPTSEETINNGDGEERPHTQRHS